MLQYDPYETTPADSTHAISRARSSSRSTLPSAILVPLARLRAKTYHYRGTTDGGDYPHVRKKDRTNLQATRRTLLTDKEARQIRVQEMVIRASSSIPVISEGSTTKGVAIDVETTEGDPNILVAGSGKPDPPTC
ncbi:hypothetical protein EJD97_016228 [Solanum chilense]|uniref:Uncharacterized protein n=1 Tax=Solanum chilense TaxID=4083 RepID=A0A6N2CF34_SOLCI|nr:hypothetical protein EJD97_016228 [Solanum chilense]